MRKPTGMTVVELIVVMAIVASIMGIGAWSLTSLTDADLRSEALRLSSVIKYTYSQAAINNTRYRLVLDLDSGEYYTEVVGEPLTVDQGDTESEEEFLTDEARQLGEKVDEERDLFADEEENPFGVNRKVTYKRVEDVVVEGRTLREGVRFDRMISAQAEEPIIDGKASVSFFPSGFQERVMIFMRDGEAFYTLVTEPLTGRVRIYSEEKDVPDDFAEVERDD